MKKKKGLQRHQVFILIFAAWLSVLLTYVGAWSGAAALAGITFISLLEMYG